MSARISGPRGIKSSGITVENEPIILSDGVGAVTQWDNSTQGAGKGIYFVEGGSAGDPLRLGIGVAAPTSLLTIQGAGTNTATGTGAAEVMLNVKNTTASTHSAIVINALDGQDAILYLSENGAERWNIRNDASDSDTLNIRDGANTRLAINSSGQVNIGTGTAQKLLTLQGNDAQIRLLDTGGTNQFASMSSEGGIAKFTSRNNTSLGAFKFQSYDGSTVVERLAISATGVVSMSGTLTVGSLDIGHGLGGDNSNTAVGQNALDASLAGCIHNTAIGNSALTALNGGLGDYNTVVGSLSTDALETGARNSTLGYGTLSQSTAGNDNVAVGYTALLNFTGSDAVAIGSGAAASLGTGAGVVAIGKDSLNSLTGTTGTCTAVGHESGLNTTGAHNNFFGYHAGKFVTTATANVAIGRDALRGDGTTAPTGDENVAIGNYSLDATTDGHSNVAIGYNTLTAATTNHSTVAIGHRAMESANGGEHQSVAVGAYALNTEASGSDGTVAVGYYALKSQDGGTGNVAVGYNVANGLDNGSDNVFIGYAAAGGSNTPTGDDNVIIGKNAGYDLSSGYRNICIGYQAGFDFTNNHNNVAIGYNAMVAANNGELYNVAIGSNALYSETSGADYCVAIGYNTMIGQNADTKNTAVGGSALFHTKSGGSNVAIGYTAGYANVDSYNTWVGFESGRKTGHAAANTALGYRAYGSSSFTNGTCDLNGSTTVTCDSNTDIQVGQSVTGSGIPYGAYVSAVNDSTGVTSFTLSEAATTNASNQTLTFYKGTGDSNTCIGYTAGEDITTGYENVLIGRDAGKNFTTNYQNVAIGAYALDAANGGEHYNVAIGYGALSVETSGADYCVAIGHHALVYQNANVKNTAIGGLAGDAITNGTGNTAVGYRAISAAAGNYNTAVGESAYDKGTGAYNTVIGTFAGSSNQGAGTAMSGNSNTILGYAAGYYLTDGPGNVLMGYLAGQNMTTGDYNVAIGYQAADALAGDSNDNIAIGRNALGADDLTSYNIAIGYQALQVQNDADCRNVAIGADAGSAVSDGTSNVLVGHNAGTAITTADSVTALGYHAHRLATGGYNVAVGAGAMGAACSGGNNVAVGQSAMASAAAGCSDNVAVGALALHSLNHNDGDKNVGIGYHAGRYYETTATTTPGSASPDGNNTAGANSIFIGYDTRSAESDRTNEIVIGHTAVSNGSNTITLGNDDTSSIHCNDTSIAALSDRRIKRDITDNNVGLDFVERLATVNYKRLNPADWPEEIRSHRYRVEEQQELVTPAVEAAEAVYEDVVVVEAREAVEEVTETIEHPAQEEVWEDVIIPAIEELSEERVTQTAQEEITEERVVQEAREEVKGERQKYTETEVTETVTREEIVEIDGKWVRREVSEEVTRTERTPVYEECDLYNEDGTQCMCCVTEARDAVTEERQVVDENGDGVVGEDGNPVMETVEIEPAVEAVHEPMKHKVPVMEEYVVQAAQDEVRETVVVQEAREEVREMVVVRKAEPERTERRKVQDAVPARTEVRVITPAKPAVEEVTERRLVSPAVEAQEAVYKTVTVPADERPDDDDTVRLGLIAQDVQTAMSDAGVEFDLVTTGANGKLAVKYSNLVIPLLKAVQELSAEVKALKG